MNKTIAPMLLIFGLLVNSSYAPLDLEGLAPPSKENKKPADENAAGKDVTPKPDTPDRQINVPAPEDSNKGPRKPAERNAFDDVLTFNNSDTLHGRLASIDTQSEELIWQHPSAKEPIKFALDGIRSLAMENAQRRKVPEQKASVKLTNGDQLAGNVVSMDADTLVLDTWYAGKIDVEKVMITSLRPHADGSKVVYEGPRDIDTWDLGDESMKNTWRLKNGVLHPLQAHPIGREIEGLPDVASLEFECDWRGYPAFNFIFYTDNVSKVSGNYYMLQVSSSSVYMRRYTSNQGSDNLWNLNHKAFSNNRSTTAKFNLLVNKETKSFSLLINGEVIKQWSEGGSFAGLGEGIMFAPQNAGGMKFYNIRVSEWDGTLPRQGEEKEVDTKEDQVQFVNKDKISGSLESIADGKASFKTAFATMDVPVERIGEITFSSEEIERARRNKQDVRLTFVNGGQLTLKLDRITENMLHGSSENFGDVQIPVDAFVDMSFNIYTKPDEDEEELDF